MTDYEFLQARDAATRIEALSKQVEELTAALALADRGWHPVGSRHSLLADIIPVADLEALAAYVRRREKQACETCRHQGPHDDCLKIWVFASSHQIRPMPCADVGYGCNAWTERQLTPNL